MNKSELKQIIKEEIHKIFSEIRIEKPGYKELFADYTVDNTDTSIKSRFARTMSETLNILDLGPGESYKLEITSLFSEEGMNQIQDGDEFYAGPQESLEFFKKLPKTFLITHNMNEDNESFEITKTGEDSFVAKSI